MATLPLFAGSGMVGHRWLWVGELKNSCLMVVVYGGGEVMAGCGWW